MYKIKVFKLLISIVGSFVLTLLAIPLVINISKKLKAGQPILKYVEQHKSKSGTPTMGGLGFVIPSCVVVLIFGGEGLSVGRISAIAVLCYCFLGFLDDFLKIRRQDNGGLTPIQKIVGQLGIACVLGYYCYITSSCSIVHVPFVGKNVDFGYWIIPFAIFIFLAVTNAVNLTDGIDGLAGNTSLYYFIIFAVILYYQSFGKEDISLLIFDFAFIGSLLAYLIFNNKPARIFMGDTGSLALGGGIAAVSVFSGNSLLIPIAGITFVFSCASVIIQVLVYKLTKKRVFKMAPFHHHLEKCGMSEPRIVSLYQAITAIFGFVAIVSVLI